MSPILAYYDRKSELIIQCDASQFGIGAALMQNGKPLAYASCALTDTESRYAIIEKEMLAVVYVLEVCLFVCGGSLTSGQLVKGSFQTA